MAALLCQTFSVHLFSRGTQYRIQNGLLILTGAKTNAGRIFEIFRILVTTLLTPNLLFIHFQNLQFIFFSQHRNILSYVKRKKMT